MAIISHDQAFADIIAALTVGYNDATAWRHSETLDDASPREIKAAPVSPILRNHVTGFQYSTTGMTNAVSLILKSGSNILWSTDIAAHAIIQGLSVACPSALVGDIATSLTVEISNDPGDGSVQFNVQGFTSI